MAKDKVLDKSVEEIKKHLSEKRIVIGAETTVKQLKQGRLDAVFLCSNLPQAVKDDLAHHCGLSKTRLIQLEQSNEELGVICKKPFPISMCGVLRV